MSFLIFNAAEFAKKAHAGQIRKYVGEPYVYHPARVAARVTLLPGATEEMVAAAWLHDTVEDCDVTVDEVREKFGPIVADLVDGLTDKFSKEDRPDLSRADRKELEHARLATTPAAVRNIKLADITDNLYGTDPKDRFAVRFLEEKEHLLGLFRERGDLDTWLLEEVERASDALKARFDAERVLRNAHKDEIKKIREEEFELSLRRIAKHDAAQSAGEPCKCPWCKRRGPG